MKRAETACSHAARHASNVSGVNHAASFQKVLDARKRKIRGLWRRGSRYYAQMTVTDPTTGRDKVQRIPLQDPDGNPPTTVPQAVALLNALLVKRTQTGIEAHARRAPRFAAYVAEYLAAISAGEGAKKPRVAGIDFMTIARWVGHRDGGFLIGKVYGHLADEHRKRMADKLTF